MMNKKILLTSAIILILLLIASCGGISKDEAIEITKEFVNTRVKVFVANGTDTPIVNQAGIQIISASKSGSNWLVQLHMQSNETGELKQANILVTVDASSGQVKDMKRLQN